MKVKTIASSFPIGAPVYAAAVTFVTFAVYARTVCPSVPPGDSGEMITSAYNMGVAHPPGYPLFILIGKLFTLLPWGSVAWRVNLMSAASDAAAAGLMYLTTARWLGNNVDALIASTAFAFSPLIWTYALVAEVFALNNFLIMVLLYLALGFFQTKQPFYAHGGALLIGLGLCNQHTIIMYALPLIAVTLWYGRETLWSPMPLMKLCMWGLIGLTPYIHLPLSVRNMPASSWGDHTNLSGILTHFLRKEYGTFQLASGHDKQSQWLLRLWLLAKNYAEETFYVGAVLTLVGIYACFREKRLRAYGGMLALIFVFYLVMFNSLANLDVHDTLFLGVQARFWQQSYIISYFFLAVGLNYIRTRFLPTHRQVAAGCVLVAISFAFMSAHYRTVDQSDYYMTEDWARAILSPLPPNSLLLLKSDHIDFPIRYLQFVEGYRTDVQALDLDLLTYRWIKKFQRHLTPLVEFPGTHYSMNEWDGYKLKDLLEANLPRMRTFLCGMVSELDTEWRSSYSLWAFGINAEFFPNGVEIPFTWFSDNLKAVRTMEHLVKEDMLPGGYTRVIHPWEYLIWRNLQEALWMNIDFFNQMEKLFPHSKKHFIENIAISQHLMTHFRANHTADRYSALQELAQVRAESTGLVLPPTDALFEQRIRSAPFVTPRLGRAGSQGAFTMGILFGAVASLLCISIWVLYRNDRDNLTKKSS